MLERLRPRCQPDGNAPLQLGALLGDSVAQGRDKLTIIADPALGPFGLWLEQLIAESTGKEGTGVVPLADEPLGPPEVYGADRLFAYLRVDGAHDDRRRRPRGRRVPRRALPAAATWTTSAPR